MCFETCTSLKIFLKLILFFHFKFDDKSHKKKLKKLIIEMLKLFADSGKICHFITLRVPPLKKNMLLTLFLITFFFLFKNFSKLKFHYTNFWLHFFPNNKRVCTYTLIFPFLCRKFLYIWKKKRSCNEILSE